MTMWVLKWSNFPNQIVAIYWDEILTNTPSNVWPQVLFMFVLPSQLCHNTSITTILQFLMLVLRISCNERLFQVGPKSAVKRQLNDQMRRQIWDGGDLRKTENQLYVAWGSCWWLSHLVGFEIIKKNHAMEIILNPDLVTLLLELKNVLSKNIRSTVPHKIITSALPFC